MRIRLPLLLCIVCCSLALWPLRAAAPRFYPDDPIAADQESQDASKAAEYEVNLAFELLHDNFAKPEDTGQPIPRAQNVNTIDEVPDSGWFTNRILARPISPDDLRRGPSTGAPPDAARWTIIRGKSSGVSPGFTARDAEGETWFLTFDGTANPEAGTGSILVANKIFHALGYWQLENHLTEVDPAKLSIGEKATIRARNGTRRAFTQDDLARVFQRSARHGQTYRAVASRLAPGKPIGNFVYYGTRSDDPNDLVPHEHRRELRAMQVFAAWTNLIDLKAGNTLDVLVRKDGRQTVRHYLQDVGSTFGTAAIHPRYPDEGWEYLFDLGALGRRLVSFGFAIPRWATVPYQEVPGIGPFEGDVFDPRTWRSRSPVYALLHMRADDAFWAARRVMAFSDDMITTMTAEGRYSDPKAAPFLAEILIKRRNKIGAVYYREVLPLVDFALSTNGELTFANAAVTAGLDQVPAQGYTLTWRRFDNATGTATATLGDSRATDTRATAPVALPSETGEYVQVDIAAVGAPHPAWSKPVVVHFRREASGWKLVGVDRGASSASATVPSRS
jgi:hypothetical protein